MNGKVGVRGVSKDIPEGSGNSDPHPMRPRKNYRFPRR